MRIPELTCFFCHVNLFLGQQVPRGMDRKMPGSCTTFGRYVGTLCIFCFWGCRSSEINVLGLRNEVKTHIFLWKTSEVLNYFAPTSKGLNFRVQTFIRYGHWLFAGAMVESHHGGGYNYRLKKNIYVYMDVSENSGTPKSSILIGFSIINHPFWGTPIFGNIHIYIYTHI